ncbi:hypothetical protein CTAYLR_007388 [Chrysophaeum taylorii]|uniref:Uncharacterized protein n=1 Tax=Chrysophaeum taylorii TaxID=2483200 RepID=A0AAD7U4J9_9STRA|nr:hypothetical protein CTAYLR_007388 [Chrysophaeum taylorii]
MRRLGAKLPSRRKAAAVEAPIPQHPGAEQQPAEEVPVPPPVVVVEEARSVVEPALGPPAEIDERLAPEWWRTVPVDAEMGAIFGKLQGEAARTASAALARDASADELCRAVARGVGPTSVLALEYAVAAGRGVSATAHALGMVPYASVRRDDAWSPTCYAAWRATVRTNVESFVVEGLAECCAAELVALATSYAALPLEDHTSDLLVAEVLRLAFDTASRSPRGDSFRDLAADQWAAAVGNLTPERGSAVVGEFARRVQNLAVLDAGFFGTLRFARLDASDAATRRALCDAVDALVAALDAYFAATDTSATKLRDDAAAVACARCLDRLVRAPDWEAVRIAANADLVALDSRLDALFRKLDDAWAPRKATSSSHPRLTRDLSATLGTLMVTVFVRMPRDAYDARLDLFVAKRLQKPAMDKKDAPRALRNLATFLRGPRWRGAAPKAAPSRWPRLRHRDDSGERRLFVARPRTWGGVRPSDHAFACCMPAFASGPELVVRPEVLVWIREKTFGVGGHYKCVELAANARLAADVVLAMLANTMTTSFVRTLLDVRESAPTTTTTTATSFGGAASSKERLERYVVGLRVVAVVLDDKSGFSRHAPTTRANSALEGGVKQVQADLRGFFAAVASDQLKRSLDLLSHETFSSLNNNNNTKDSNDAGPAGGAPACVLDVLDADGGLDVADGARYDARTWDDAAPFDPHSTKMLHLQIIQETARCAPFAPWRALGRGLLDAGLLHYGAPCVRRSLRVALQRAVIDRPDERIDLVCDVFSHAATCLADGAPARAPALEVPAQLLALWKRVLRDGADGRSRADAAADANAVLELDADGGHLGWTARAEATALAFLADDDPAARDAAIDALDAVLAVRAAQLRLVDAVGTTTALVGDHEEEEEEEKAAAAAATIAARRRASAALSARNVTIRELLLDGGLENDIAQRAIRAFVDKMSQGSSSSKNPLATSAPTLRKLSKMSNDLWFGALPLVAAAVATLDRRAALATHAQRLLCAALRKRNAFKLAPARFEAQLSLLVALHLDSAAKDLDDFLGEHAWPLLDDADGSTSQVVPGAEPKTTCARLAACCRASSAAAARPIVASLLAWLRKAEQHRATEKRAAARRAAVWALLRATVESARFKTAAAQDRALVSLLSGALVSDAFLDTATTTSQSVVDRVVLIDAVADAVVETHASLDGQQPSEPGRRRMLPRWAAPELAKLYDWLRATHVWPRPGGPLETNWRVAPFKPPLAASHDDQPCTTQKGVPDADGLCLAVAGRAVAKLLAMGAFLSAATIEGLLDEASPPKDLTWFLTAERLGPTARCLPWLVSYHAETLAPAFVRRAVSAPKEGAVPFFHAIADQLLPAASLPLAPSRAADANASSAYFKAVIQFGVDSDLAQLALGDRDHHQPKRAPAVALAAVFDDDRFVAGRPERLGASSILLLGLRAVRDPDVSVRLRAFLLVRTVTLHLLDVREEASADDDDASLAATTRSDFVELMSSYWVVFSSECSSRRDAEADAILECVAACVGAAGDDAVHDLISEINGQHSRNREEWGGAATTARILGALCKHVVLEEEEEEEEEEEGGDDKDARRTAAAGTSSSSHQMPRAASSRGTDILTGLIRFCVTHGSQAEQLWTALCAPGGRGGARNVAAIVVHVRRVAARAARTGKPLTLAACQSAALACYAADAATTARLLTEPFGFEAHDRAVDAARGVFSPLQVEQKKGGASAEEHDALVDAAGAVALLSALGGVDPESLVPYLHVVAHFCILHFASPTRFGGGAHSLSADFSQRNRIPRLLHTLVLNLQPVFLAAEAKRAGSAWAGRVNSILAVLRAGVDAHFLELDWSRPVAALGDPTLLCARATPSEETPRDAQALDSALSARAWVEAVPSLDVAAGPGGLASPVALVVALREVLEAASPRVTTDWGRESLRWALVSRDFPTRLKAYVVYLTLGAPDVRKDLPAVLDALASLHAELSNSSAAAAEGRDAATTGVSSTAHYQAASTCCALLRVLGAALFDDDGPVALELFWVADAALRTRCLDETRCRIYRYGVALLRGFVARTLEGDDETVAELAERLEKTKADYRMKDEEGPAPFTSSPLLDAAARLAVGILCDDPATNRDARDAVAPVLSRVAPANAPSKKETRATFACLLAALAPWLASRAGSFDAIDVAADLARVALAGAGDGGYLGATLRDNLVASLPPDVSAFTQRCAAWLAGAAAGASDPARFLRRVDAALAAAVGSSYDNAAMARGARNAAPTRAAALSLAAELFMRDDGGPDAARARVDALRRVTAVALDLCSKTALAVRRDPRDDDRRHPGAVPVVAGGRSLGRRRSVSRSTSWSSIPVVSAASSDALPDDDRVADDECLAASAIASLVVEHAGVSAALLDATRPDDDADGDDFLGTNDASISARLRAVSAGVADPPRATQPRQNVPATPRPSVAAAPRLRDDPRFAPYAPFFALMARGVPLGAVRLRAVAEGLDSRVLHLDPDEPLPDGAFPQQQELRSAATPQPPRLTKPPAPPPKRAADFGLQKKPPPPPPRPPKPKPANGDDAKPFAPKKPPPPPPPPLSRR